MTVPCKVSFDPYAVVFVRHCSEYEMPALCAAVSDAFSALGFSPASFAGKTVVIKPNLVMKKPAEAAATTHPLVLDAVLSYLDACDTKAVIIAESMGGPYTESALRAVYHGCGIDTVAEKHNASLNYDVSSVEMSYPNGTVCKQFTVISPIAHADIILNLCKLKSHSLTRMSGAVKNTFGTVPGLTKFEYHARFSDYTDFNKMLVDLSAMHHARVPMIDLCDAIIGMEGNGPTGGMPRKIGCILASRNPFALDTVAAALLACETEVPMVNEAHSRGYCPACANDVAVVGDDWKNLVLPDFVPPDASQQSTNALHWLPKLFGGKLYRWFSPRPVIRTTTCVGCGECARSCPVHTIEMQKDKNGKKKAHIKHDACIRCFCCQELCPYNSIDIHKNPVMQLINKLGL